MVAGPGGEDLSHAVGAANANRHDSTFQTYVETVPASEEAATLTKGSSSEGVSYPGRRKEDDENLVVEEPQTFDWQVGGGGSDESFRGKSRSWIDDKPGTARALTSNKTLAVHVPEAVGFNAGQDDKGLSGDEVSPPVVAAGGRTPNAVAFRQTPQGDVGVDSEAAYPVMNNDGIGNNRSMVAITGEPKVYAENPDGKVYEGDEAAALQTTHGAVRQMLVEGQAATLKGQRGKGGGGIGPEETLVATGFKTDGSEADMTLPVEEGTPPLRTQNTMAVAYGLGSHAGTLGEATNESHGAGGPVGQGITEEETPALVSGRTQAVAYAKLHGAASSDDDEHWDEAEVSRTIDKTAFATTAVVEESTVAFHEDQRTGAVYENDHTHALAQPGGKPGQGYAGIRSGSAVRRLSPVECERLQGFPDGWTAIDGDATPDGPRYAALGDAVTVNPAFWIVRRLIRRRELGLE